MAEQTAVAQKNTTALSWWTTELTNMVSQDYMDCGVQFDEYSKKCAMSAMTNIYQLVKTSGVDIKSMDTSNLREIVGQCASLKLNANAVPRECYFQLRKKKIGNNYVQTVEMGIEGDGNDAILRNFGEDVEMVYPVWIVKEGDTFTYPKHRGVEITPPEWEQTGESEKTDKVVYPVKLKDGTVQYLIAERQSVKVNLFAHVRNNLMNETFGICENRYKATDKQLAEIKGRKEVIFEALRKCNTVEEMLECEQGRPYISAAWLDTPESMIVRKMRNNAIKKFKKNYDAMAQKSFMQIDETYQQTQEEITENANSEPFVVAESDATNAPVEPNRVASEVVDSDENVPDFMK